MKLPRNSVYPSIHPSLYSTFVVVTATLLKVTDGSKGCIVLAHLYEDSIVECQVLDEAMQVVAAKFKYLKFVRIKSTHAIENWPERNLPTLFIYEEGNLRTQLVTLRSIGGKSAKPAGVII